MKTVSYHFSLRQLSNALLLCLVIALTVPLMTTSAQEKPRGGTFTVVLIAEPRTIDTTTGTWNNGFVAAQMYNSLLTLDEKLNIVPSLAERYSVDTKEGSFTFNLRRNVQWHDGKPLTAADVKFSFEEITAKFDTFGVLYFKDVAAQIIDDFTVKVKVKEFLPAVQLQLIASLDTAILPKHILEGQDFLKSEFRTTKPVGTGPFKLQEWVKGSHIILVKNENYWAQGQPYLDKIVIRFIPDPGTVLAAFERGEADYVFRGVPFEAYGKLKANDELEVIPSVRPPYKAMLPINLKHPILGNVKVRQAMAYALNREEIAARATNSISKTTDTFWTTDIAPQSPNIAIYKYNTAKAEQLLDEAGYPKKADGKRFTIELLTRRGEPEEALAVELIRDQLGKVGIDVTVKTVDFATYLDLQANYQFDFYLLKRWVTAFWTYQLLHSAWIQKGKIFVNVVQYRNPEVDRLFDSWLREPDPAKQTQILQRIDEIATNDLPEIPIYNVVWLNVKRKTFLGPDMPVGKYVFFDTLENTYWSKGTVPQPTTSPLLIAVAVVIVVGIVAGALVLRRRAKSKAASA